MQRSTDCPSFSNEFLKIKEDKYMAKPYKIPDFRKIYPNASEEVIAVLRKTERQMQYQEYDIKAERTVIDHKTQTVLVIPSREDSYERLVELDEQFEAENKTEEIVIQKIVYEQLHHAISLLSEDEQYLIKQLFFEERTERELDEEYQLSQNAINKRRKKVLSKLKRFLENF